MVEGLGRKRCTAQRIEIDGGHVGFDALPTSHAAADAATAPNVIRCH